MQKTVAYFLLITVLLPIVSPWGTIAYYQTNRDYIARVLCENRDKPQLHCDGKCYLAKKLRAQQDKQDKETTERVQNLPTLQMFCLEHASFQFLLIRSIPQRIGFSYLLSRYSAPLAAIFQPPATTC
jgi:hypothetical protein